MVIDDRIEIMELVTSIIGSKAPRDSAALRIAFGLQCGNALAQLLHAFHPTRQTAPGKNTDLDLGHVQPTAMFGRVMELTRCKMRRASAGSKASYRAAAVCVFKLS